MNHLIDVSLIILAYLFGSISSAVVVSKLWRLPDPRTVGSKNPGATNVLRQGKKLPALVTLLGDALKAVIPVLIAKWLGLSPLVQATVVLTACLGHMYPIFFKFKGGKGVATGFGGILALSWPVGLMALATWLIIARIFKYSSLSALVSYLLLPVYIWTFSSRQYIIPICLLSLIVIIKHHKNIKNLIQGKESKIGKK